MSRWYSLFLQVFIPLSSIYGESISSDKVLWNIKARIEGLENLSVKTKWFEFQSGNLIDSAEQWIVKDRFGRIRVKSRHGTPASRKKLIDESYNGEFTISYSENPSLNRLGEVHNAVTLDNGEYYRLAIINEGLGADGRGPNVYRNPFSFISLWIIEALEKYLEKGESFTVDSINKPDADYVIQFQWSPDEEAFKTNHSVFVDSTKNWAITRHERKSESGQLLALTTCTYAEYSNGDWLPESGVWKVWNKPGTQQVADMEWRFQVQEIKYNALKFDESVFDIPLEEGTYVVDNRYDVSYYVGDEKAVASDLATLAQKALADQAVFLESLKIKHSDISQGGVGSFLRYILVFINVAAVIILVFFVVRSRRNA